MANDITVYRGDTVTKSIAFTANSVAVNITGWTVFFTVKTSKDDVTDDSSAVLKKTITVHTNPTAGETLLSLSASDLNTLAGKYFYDIQIKQADGTIKTVVAGRFIIEKEVTRRVA